jgi:hypothetical protein
MWDRADIFKERPAAFNAIDHRLVARRWFDRSSIFESP